MKDRIINWIWSWGVHAFRASRTVHLSGMVEPIFILLAGFVPSSRNSEVAMLPLGSTLLMPPGYRDARTVRVGLFQEAETKLFQSLLYPGMTVADVGAYVGYFTVLASRLVGSAGRVFAFEPDEMAFEYLARNIAENDCRNVVATRKAISDRAAVATLVRDPRGPESFLADVPIDHRSRAVDTLSMDLFFETIGWPSVDLVKMNIEGGELHALWGMTDFSRRNPNLKLVMEFNPWAMRRAEVSRSDLTDALKKLGFRRCQIVERGLKDVPDTGLVPAGRAVYNLLLTKQPA